jgi:hypothetical protein
MNEASPTVPDQHAADEVGSVARELSAAYRQMVAFYRDEMKLPPVDADGRARGALPDADLAWDRRMALDEPADQVSWYAISHLAERDPDAAMAAWQRIKAEATKELETGHRTAKALEWGDKPWDRARFLAVLDAFAAAWQPRGGVEAALVDILTQSFVEFLEWTEISTVRSETEAQVEESSIRRHGSWGPPRVAIAEAMTDAARRVERAHRRFLVTLRAMQDLRRLPSVHVARAHQLNIGGQQIILAPLAMTGDADEASGADAEV